MKRYYFSLIDTMGYLVVIGMVMTMAVTCYIKATKSSANMHLASHEIIMTNQLGDKWRDHIRNAASVGLEDGLLVVKDASGVRKYRFWEDKLEHSDQSGVWETLESSIAKGQFRELKGKDVIAWQLEIELESHYKKGRTKPLFSFIAVAKQGGAE